MDLTGNEIIQVNISGYDKPGLTTTLTDILAKHDAFILDIGQANIHQTLILRIPPFFYNRIIKSVLCLKEEDQHGM